MRQRYKIMASDGQGWWDECESTSRNAKKHLRNFFGAQDGAICTVRTMRGKFVCECRYSSEFGYYYTTGEDTAAQEAEATRKCREAFEEFLAG